MKKLLLTFTIPIILLTGCTGSQIPPEVCTYGNAICDVGEFICNSVPQIPEPVCIYLEAACTSLNVLCSYPSDSPEFQQALSDLKKINDTLGADAKKSIEDQSN